MTDPALLPTISPLGVRTVVLRNTTSSVAGARTQVTWDSSAQCDDVPYAFHAIVGVFVTCLGVLAILGNFLVLVTYARHNRLQTSSNLLIVNLTVADLIMASLDFPILAIACFNGCWMLGFLGCQVYGLSSAISCLVTINTLAVIALDRYVVVVRRHTPSRRLAKSTTGGLILVVWVSSAVWSFVPLTGLGSYRLEGMGTSCTFDYVTRTASNRCFFIFLTIFNFFLPLIIIAFSYYHIHRFVCEVKRELKLLQTARQYGLKKRFQMQAEIKTAVTAMMIIVIFCTAWTPYVIVAFVGLFGPEQRISPLVSMFPNILAKLSTVSNPILYSIGHPEVRKIMKKIVFSNLPETFSTTWRATSATAANSTPRNSETVEKEDRNSIHLQPTFI